VYLEVVVRYNISIHISSTRIYASAGSRLRLVVLASGAYTNQGNLFQ